MTECVTVSLGGMEVGLEGGGESLLPLSLEGGEKWIRVKVDQ